jgi:LPS O-antigen subunit length determinant protein (WzzB/FepE family)
MKHAQTEKTSMSQLLWTRRWLLVILVVISVIIAGIYAYRLPPEFQTEAVLRVRPLADVDAAVQSVLPNVRTLIHLLYSQELLLQVIAETKLTERDQSAFADWTRPYLANWLRTHIKVTQPDKTDLLVIELAGPFSGGTATQEFFKHYLAVFQKRLEDELDNTIKIELARLADLQAGLSQERQNITEEATRRAADRRAQLRIQEKELKGTMAALKTKANLRIPAGEQNATFEGVALREDYQVLASQLEIVQKELSILDAKGIETFEELYGALKTLEQEAIRTALLSIKLKQLDENFSVLEEVNPPFAPTAPVGPSRLGITLIGGVVGFFIALLLIFLLGPARANPKVTSS